MKKELLIKEKLKEKENILQMWSLDVKALVDNKKFDQYSWRGQRKLNRLSKKYAPMIVQIDKEIEEIEALEED